MLSERRPNVHSSAGRQVINAETMEESLSNGWKHYGQEKARGWVSGQPWGMELDEGGDI